MNWKPTAYPGGTSLKPLKIDLIWVLTEHTIKDLLASLTILYCVGRDLMAAPFSSANIMIGLFEDDIFFYFPGLRCFCLRIWGLSCFEDDVFSLSGAVHFHLTSKWLEQPVFPHIIRPGRPVCMFSVFWEEGGEFGRKGRDDQAEKKGFQFI